MPCSDSIVLQACSAAIARVLGPSAVSLLPHLAATGVDISGSAMPAFLSAITTGPSSPVGSGRAISEWRRQRRELPLELSQLLHDIPNLPGALQEAIALLSHHSGHAQEEPRPSGGTSVPGMHPSSAGLHAGAAEQVASTGSSPGGTPQGLPQGAPAKGQVANASGKVLQGLLLLGEMCRVSPRLCDIQGFSLGSQAGLEAALQSQLVELWLTGRVRHASACCADSRTSLHAKGVRASLVWQAAHLLQYRSGHRVGG